MRERFVELCHAKSEDIFDALLTVALGKFEVVSATKSSIRTYTEPPNVAALREICDRVWGRPTTTVDISTQFDINTETDLSGNSTVQKITQEYEEKLKQALAASIPKRVANLSDKKV